MLSGEGVTPVQKVIELLSTMMAKGTEDKHQEQVTFTKFKQFCGLTRADKGRTIQAAADEIVELEAAVVKAEADADKFGGEISALDADIAGWDSEARRSAEVRKKELGEYSATHQDYSESIVALERALQTLKSTSADTPQSAQTAAASLLELERAGSGPQLPAAARSTLAALVQRGAGGEAGAPEANAYEFQSATVVDMLEKLRSRFIEERHTLEKEEINRKHAYELLLQSLRDNIAHGEATRGKKVAAKAVSLQDAASAKGDLQETRTGKAADEAYLRDLNVGCELKSKEFESRQVLRAEELKALQQATEILSSPDVAGAAGKHLPAAMLQFGASQPRALVQLQSGDASAKAPAQARAASLLREHAARAHSSFLATIAGRVAEDPFMKVRKMIKDLLVRLLEEANEEADHKAWCDHELATNKQSRDNFGTEVESLTAQVDELSALSAKLGQEISDLSDEIASIEAARSKATAEREEEKAMNAATIADAKAATAAVMQATKILKEFYTKAADATAFVQKRKQEQPEDAPATWGSTYMGMQGHSTGVLGVLDVLKSDFARLEAKTSTAEDEAQREYERFMSDSDTDKATKDKEMRHKGFKKDSTQRKLNSAKKELSQTQEELTAALDYYDKLKPSCIDTGATYEDRVARRKEEIQSLKEALRILEGEDLSGPAAGA